MDYPTFSGETPLHLASGRNDKSFVSFLIAAGADPEPSTAMDRSPALLTTSAEVRAVFEEITKAKRGKTSKKPKKFIYLFILEGRSLSLSQMFQPAKTTTSVVATTTAAAAAAALVSGGIMTSGGHGVPPGQLGTSRRAKDLLSVL